MSKVLTLSRRNTGWDRFPVMSPDYNVQTSLRGYFNNIKQFYVAG